jgi:hypothetical protein
MAITMKTTSNNYTSLLRRIGEKSRMAEQKCYQYTVLLVRAKRSAFYPMHRLHIQHIVKSNI